MSRMLNLGERLLDLGRNYLDRGREQEALLVLGRLVRLGELPSPLAEEAQLHLAEVHLRRQKYPEARRHLNVALARRPDCARYHHLMATTLDEEEGGDIRRALYHHRRAVELAPDDASYQCDYGLCLLAVGDTAAGLQALEKAVQLAPHEPRYVEELALAHLDHGQPETARKTVLAALFRNSHDLRFRQLWQDLRFRAAREGQLERMAEARARSHARPVLLSFTTREQPVRKESKDGRVLRIDPAGSPSPSHLPERARKRHTR